MYQLVEKRHFLLWQKIPNQKRTILSKYWQQPIVAGTVLWPKLCHFISQGSRNSGRFDETFSNSKLYFPGRELWSFGYERRLMPERSWVWIPELAAKFFTFIRCKNCIDVVSSASSRIGAVSDGVYTRAKKN